MERIRNLPRSLLETEIQEMRLTAQNSEEELEEKWGIIKVLKDRTLMLPLLLVCSLQAGQQFSGINAVNFRS